MTSRALVRRRTTDVAGLIDRMPNPTPSMTLPLRVGGLSLWLFGLALGLFGVMGTWAATATMQSAVVASGLFRVQGNNLVVQHLEGGIVRNIAVTEGAVVQEGDVIARLDDTRALASLGILQNQLAGALATEARLQAEFIGAEGIAVPTELSALIAQNPAFAAVLQNQLDVFRSGRQLEIGQVQILQDRISQLTEQGMGISHRATAMAQQLSLLQEDLASLSQLYDKGLTTKPQFLAMQRDENALMGDIAVAETQRQTVLQQIAEIEERKLQVRRDRLIEITNDRQAIGATIADLRQRIDAAQDVLDRLTIVAPRAGRVMDLRINTIGEVIEGGAKLLEIVPNGGDFVIEVRISPSDINQVSEGGEARVRLTAYNFRTTPIVKGHVTHVSADSFVDERTGQPYFMADVRINQGEFDALPSVEMLLGMPAQVMISTGEQTMADYLLRPILGGMEVALSESE
ncbi:MAG: HlyD family type I secretion periplasmic adaptor subunit [Paracoccaceae bacterium]